METQEQKDERMALELFPDIPKKTKIREHVDAQFDNLTGHRDTSDGTVDS